MSELTSSVASLRIFGDDLNPDEITALLGTTPTFAERRGQETVSKRGATRIARTGRWSLEAAPASPGNLEAQIAQLLSRTSDDLSGWSSLTARYRVEIFCGLFLDEQNEGLSLSPQTLKRMGERGILLGIDIYAPEATDPSPS